MLYSQELPPGLTLQSLNSFIFETWNRTAKLAYKGYLDHGRGLVVWQWNQTTLDFTMLGFVTKQEAQNKNFGSKYIQMINGYEPKNSLVLGITWQTGDDLYDTLVMLLKIQNMSSPLSIYSQQHN